MQNEKLDFLKLSYDCLSSIGTSLELDSMVYAFLCTFSQKTKAIAGCYFMKNGNTYERFSCPNGMVDIDLTQFQNLYKPQIIEDDTRMVIAIPILYDFLFFSYPPQTDIQYLNKVMEIFFEFRNKIIISKNSCINVQKIQELNQNLESKIKEELRKNIEKEKLLIAQSKQAVMGEMISMIAHQWRQPITTIGMIANNLKLDIDFGEFDREKTEKELVEIDKIIHYLSKTIDNFRNFFQPDKAKTKFYVRQLIDDSFFLIRKMLESKKIAISVEIKEEVIVNSYKNELIQVVINIIKNSQDALLEHKIENPKISISSFIDHKINLLTISICDNGGGIKADIKDKIFEPYFSTKNEKNGTGLGLYMSKAIVEEHAKGSLDFENTQDGVCFYIKIPIEQK